MELRRKTLKLMGSHIDILIFNSIDAESILDDAVEMLKMYEHRFSANDDSSELMVVNHNAGIKAVEVHPDLFDLIKIGKLHSCAPNSFLNIAIGPIVQTWRIGFNDVKVPTKQEIDDLLEITDPNQILLDEEKQSVFLAKKGMAINLGALAKGYIADLMIEYMKKRGVDSGLINLGGNVLAFGDAKHNPDLMWRIGIKNQSVVTSGIYERKHTENGKTYHHILNPETGYPVETNVAGLSIISTASVDGEIWTTRLFGKSVEDILDEVNSLPDIEAVVVTTEGKVYYTSGVLDRIIC